MRRMVMSGLVLCAALLQASPVSAVLYYGFRVGVAHAPPPPVFDVAREPRLTCVTDAMVYVVDDKNFDFDGDVFRYGQFWFVYRSGYWYRAHDHGGPYVVIDVRRVPRAIIGVPRSHWKHHPPEMRRAVEYRHGPMANAHRRHARHHRREHARRNTHMTSDKGR